MENLTQLLDQFISIVIDITQLALVVVAVLIVAVSIYGMARNRTAAWDNLLYVPIVLIMGAVLLQYYPPLVMKSVRLGVEGSRGEANLLREEMRQWIPDQIDNRPAAPLAISPAATGSGDVTIDTSQPTTVTIITPESFPAASPAPAEELRQVSTPQPANTPWPQLPTATPQPTRCTYTINGLLLNCPPTPQP